MYHCSCHGNFVTIAIMPMFQGRIKPNMKSIQLETNELLMYHCGCHGNLVAKATKNVADAYHPKEPPYQICAQYCLRQRNY